MKCNLRLRILILIIVLLFLINPVNAAWADTNYAYRTTVSITNPYHFSLNISNSVGTNNATYVFCNGHCNTGFSDIRFYLDNTTLLPYWIEDSTTGKVWINVTSVGSGTVNMYYGNSSVSSLSNGNTTFYYYNNGCTNCYFASPQTFGTNTAIRSKYWEDTDNRWLGFTDIGNDPRIMLFDAAGCGANTICYYSATTSYQTIGLGTEVAHTYDIIRNGTTNIITAVDDANVQTHTYQAQTTKATTGDATHLTKQVFWFFVRNASYPAPTFGTWGIQEGYLINSNWNNYTNDNSLAFSLTGSSYIFFNVTNTSSVNFFSWFFNGANQSINSNGTSFTISTAGLNNITVIAENSTGITTSVTWMVTLPFNLLTPANGSTVTSMYPPLDTPVEFSWSSLGYPYYELVISRTPDFTMIVSDTYVTETHKNVSLSGGSYWWKVRNYNPSTGIWGYYSNPFNFTLSITTVASGRGVDGVVYELIGGVYTPIDQATVYIYNTTWSSLIVTGTNGYYLFSPLANGTYNIYASKNGYDTTVVFPITVNGSITTNDILMKIFISPYIPNFVFEKFIVRDLFDRSYLGVTVNVYKNDSPVTSFTDTTDSTGAVVFQLIKDQRYRVTFTGGGISGTITIYIFAKEESYYVRVLSGFPTGGDRFADILTNLTSIQYDATTTNLTLIYNDTLNSTSLINFYVRNLSTGVNCYKTNTSNVVSIDCNVPMSGSYQFGFNATSSVYGFFQEDKIINFDVGKPTTPAIVTNVDKTLLQWASIILIVLTAALFSIKTVKYGAVVVPALSLTLWSFGWFEPIVGGAILTNFTLLACAMVLGTMIYLRQSEIKINY